MKAQRSTTCFLCSGTIAPGERIRRRGDVWVHAECPPDDFQSSPEQQALFEFVRGGHGNLVVDAVPGSGKTTTMVRSLRYTPDTAKVLFVAYTKDIAAALAGRTAKHVRVCTLHSFGFSVLRRASECWLDVQKVPRILSRWLPASTDSKTFGDMIRLVSLAKSTLVDADDLDAVRQMADRYGLLLDQQLDVLIDLLPFILRDCREDTKRADYDDMIWLPVVLDMEMEHYDFVGVDEGQDLNAPQIEMVLRIAGDDGRIVVIGDRFQSLFGFRGADMDAIPRIIAATEAVMLPLSITYRCLRLHVALAQAIVPHIQARPDAPEGTVCYIDDLELASMLHDGDMVICRTNEPLMSPALRLIGDGVKAVVRGRDIGASLASLARRLEAPTMKEMYANLHGYTERELQYMQHRNASELAVLAFQDKLETLVAIMDECRAPGEVADRIEHIFSDQAGGVVFSTVHRAKGLEAERVFILRPDLMPHSRAQQAWEQQQERNIEYAALTRSKADLYFVRGSE